MQHQRFKITFAAAAAPPPAVTHQAGPLVGLGGSAGAAPSLRQMGVGGQGTGLTIGPAPPQPLLLHLLSLPLSGVSQPEGRSRRDVLEGVSCTFQGVMRLRVCGWLSPVLSQAIALPATRLASFQVGSRSGHVAPPWGS